MEQKLITGIHTFNSLFSYLSNQPRTVCWIRSIDYKKQLFLSPQFEIVFGGSCNSLCENPNSWWNYILPNDINTIRPIIQARTSNPIDHDENSIILFRINSPDGNIKYIRDISFTVLNENQKPIAIAGYGEEISAEFWHQIASDKKNKSKHIPTSGKKSIITILQEENELLYPMKKEYHNKLTQFKINNIRVKLTKRETQVLEHLREGKTAKETGNAIFLSQRTVETHLENIKNKTGCKTKLELMSKVAHLDLTQ